MKDHISPSQIGQWKKCPRQWAFVALEHRYVPPSGAQHLGSSFHKAAEAHNQHKLLSRTDLPLDELEDRYSQAFDATPSSEIVWEKDDQRERVYEDGAKITRLFGATSAKEIQPAAVEQAVLIPTITEDALPILCRLDVVDDQGRVIDYKTTGRAPSAGDAQNSDQLTAYACAHSVAFDGLPSSVGLDFFVRPTKTRPTGLHERQTSVRGYGQIATWLDDARAVTSQMRHAEQTGLFPYAAADDWHCSARFCGFYQVCPGGAARRTTHASASVDETPEEVPTP